MDLEVNIADMRVHITDILNRVAYGGERVKLLRRKKVMAVIVSMDDLALLEAMEDRDDLKAVRKALKEKGSIPWNKARADLVK